MKHPKNIEQRHKNLNSTKKKKKNLLGSLNLTEEIEIFWVNKNKKGFTNVNEKHGANTESTKNVNEE